MTSKTQRPHRHSCSGFTGRENLQGVEANRDHESSAVGRVNPQRATFVKTPIGAHGVTRPTIPFMERLDPFSSALCAHEPEFLAPASWSAVTSGVIHRFGVVTFQRNEPNRKRLFQNKSDDSASSGPALQDLAEHSTVHGELPQQSVAHPDLEPCKKGILFSLASSEATAEKS